MIEVWYIRHGESEANAGLATENPATIGLTKLGEEQAQKVSVAFEKSPNQIITSKYKRAIQTAEPTVQRFSGIAFETQEIHEFTYLSPATLGNTTQQERRPLSRAYWEKCNPSYIHGEGSESFEHFINRVKNFEEQITKIDNVFVAVFCHGFVIKALLWANLLGTFDTSSEHMRNFYNFHKSFDLPNCGIIKAEYRSTMKLYSGLITEHLN